LDELNASIGPIGKGDFIVVGARPDAGKTTFLASEITHMASQLPPEGTLLWLNNEERCEKVQARIITAALGVPYENIEKDWASAYEEYCREINGDVGKIVLKDISGAYVSQINRVVKRLNPSVIVIDQLRKIHGFEREAGNETTRQELIFNWARDLAKEYAPVITVHQADGTAENQEWIDMSQLHMSKTGIQGEADAIITIGRTMTKPKSRFIYVPKNKMQGDDPAMRNGKFEVEIDGPCARFRGVL
jgi:KaiC/GvpD/RAD55 family RecA-like ATPase